VTTTVFLVRHAVHDRVGTVLCGRMPGVALGPVGHIQAEALGIRLRDEGIQALYSSPMQRCLETARVVGHSLALTPRQAEAANEIDFGAWTGRDFATLAGDPLWERWNTQRDTASPPGGETMAAAAARILSLLEVLRQRHPEGRVAVVSHGDVIKAALGHYLGLPLQAYGRFDIDPGSVSALTLWEGGGKVLQMNEVPAATDEPRHHGGMA
jgi:probable phosphoglycerate mutase